MGFDNVFGYLDFDFVRAWPLARRQADSYSQDSRRPETSVLCGLTFELSGRQRQDARPGPVKMYGVPPARAWRPAGGAPLERGVRRRRFTGR